ncbi:MFS transporter [Paenibacillus alkalitolerans]|uniref:MFS transporter n=1 Tax=Paenibacillus alkalitolerans TaxID=2799335 RepID=UPI0018F35DA5|nr:MFS transporter [Paenibacillus alkalitolerans]
MERTNEIPAEKLWTRDFILLAAANGMMFFGFQMLLTTLPVYVREFGGSNAEVGWIIGIFTFVALLARPFAGWALDTVPKKRVLLFGLVFCLIAVGLYGWAGAVVFVLLVRVVHGFGFGISTTTFGTIVSDIVPPSRRGEGVGYFGLAATLAMTVGPVGGLTIMDMYGFDALFAVSFGSTAAALLMSTLLHGPGKATDVHTAPAETAAAVSADAKPVNWTERIVERRALFPALLMLLICSAYGGVVTFITLYGEERALENVGWFFTTNALCLFLVRPVAGRLFDRQGHIWVLLPGAVSGFIGMLILSYATSTWILIMSAVFFGIAFGAIQPSLQAWVINRVPAHRRGTANATLFSAVDLGFGVGSVVLGPVADLTGSFAAMYRISSLPFVVFIAVYLFYNSRINKLSRK